jgi:hypothetical protein
MSATTLLILRATLAFLFAAVLLADFISSFNQGNWFIYLTKWSFILETCYLWSATYVSFRARFKIQETGNQQSEGMPATPMVPERLPWFVSLAWLLWSIAMPISIMVSVVFWTVLDPFWAGPQLSWNTLCVHLINTLLLLVELMISRNAFYLKHAGAVYLYGFLYLFWSLIDFWARIGNRDGCSSRYADWHDCPIYFVLDWHDVSKTLVWVVAILVFVGLDVLAVWALVRLRDACAACSQQQDCISDEQGSSANESKISAAQLS